MPPLTDRIRPFVLSVGMVLLVCSSFSVNAARQDLIKQGEYIFRAAGCAACHTDSENKGPFLGGGVAFKTPFGTFYSPNISSDPNYGIGDWTEADLTRALTEGKARDGSDYYPVFPFTSYTHLSPTDIQALHAYLMSTPGVNSPSRAHELPWWMQSRFSNRLWKLLFFTPGAYKNNPAQSLAWNRGAYLVKALAHCGECHTPRNAIGVTDSSQSLAGNRNGPEGTSVPNITPDKATGIADWSAAELVDYLSSGLLPDGDYAGGLMAQVIDEGLQYLTVQDLKAIALYLQSIPAVRHQINDISSKSAP